MDSSKEHKFNDEWKKALEKASVPPSLKVWENIEKILDEEKKVTPLWWKTTKVWGVAASVLAVLLAGGVWYQLRGDQSQILSDVGTIKNEKSIIESTTELNSAANLKRDSEVAVASKTHKTSNDVTHFSGKNKPDGYFESKKFNSHSDDVSTDYNLPKLSSIDQQIAKVNQEENRLNTVNEQAENHVTASEFSPQSLVPHMPKLPEIYVQKRFVFYNSGNREVEDEEYSKSTSKEYWAGVSFAPGIFSPNVNIKASPEVFSEAFSTSINTQARESVSSVGKSSPDLSFSFQTQGGVRLSKHWSIESGIGYLQGNSRYQGGGYLLNVATSGSQNVLESAINKLNSTPIVKPLEADSKANVHVDINNLVRNNYQFLQVPMQAGFTLNPDGKLSYALLGGMTTNVFLNNQIESANGNITKTNVSDNVYRPLAVAASTGIRLNYQVAHKWKATLTGTYMQSLSSGFKSNQQLDSHPYMYGVSWGVRYSF